MIPAHRNKRFEAIFGPYNERYLLRRQFHTLFRRGEVNQAEDKPVLYMMNHSSWWDGLVVYHLILQDRKRKHYMMMDEKQMKRYPFFRKIGAFSIDKSSVRGITESLRYASGLLKQKEAVWLFPQGDIYHQEARPLQFASGIGYLLERCPEAIVQPVTAYYSMTIHQKPVASLWFGDPIAADWTQLERKVIVQLLRDQLEAQLDEHRSLTLRTNDGHAEGFVQAIAKQRSINETFDRFVRRATSWKSFFGR